MAAALLAGVTVFVLLASLKQPPPQVQPAARVFRVPVHVVERLDVRPLVSTFGTARAEQEVLVSAEVAGRIVEARRIDVGRAVLGPPENADVLTSAGGELRGELLIRIDPETYRQRVRQAEALLAQDAAELEKLDQDTLNTRELLAQSRRSLASAQSQLHLQERLMKEGAGRQTEFQRAELEYRQYESAALQLQTELNLEMVRRKQIEAREAAHQRDLELAELDVGRADVSAPFSGVISESRVETGQYVRPGDPLLKITSLDRVELPLPLPVSRAGAIAELLLAGEQPRVQFAEHENAECRWVGRVTRLAPVANELTRTIDAYAEVDNTQGRDPLRPGTFVHAKIDSGLLPGVMLVPREALFDGAVFVARPGPSGEGPEALAERREVQVEGHVDSFAIVAAGLAAGERVVLSNLEVLSDGTHLKVTEERTVQSEVEREALPAFEIVEATPVADAPVTRHE
jgi:RND family efflux transporter MFP subunit